MQALIMIALAAHLGAGPAFGSVMSKGALPTEAMRTAMETGGSIVVVRMGGPGTPRRIEYVRGLLNNLWIDYRVNPEGDAFLSKDPELDRLKTGSYYLLATSPGPTEGLNRLEACIELPLGLKDPAIAEHEIRIQKVHPKRIPALETVLRIELRTDEDVTTSSGWSPPPRRFQVFASIRRRKESPFLRIETGDAGLRAHLEGRLA